MTQPTLPLGRETGYPNKYDPGLLFAIARSDSRGSYVTGALPFHGTDVWNAWDLTWLHPDGLPAVATAELRIPAESPNLVESKSLKLYLNSFSMSRFADAREVETLISRDLAACTGSGVQVQVRTPQAQTASLIGELPGICIDSTGLSGEPVYSADATLLRCDPGSDVSEQLHSHLLRSLCPVTSQPDIGSIAIHYQGPAIDHAALLSYIVSFREHNDFHEACVERIFVDLLQQCGPEKLSVTARYQRRGGIDINPFRSNWQQAADNPRLWRQ